MTVRKQTEFVASWLASWLVICTGTAVLANSDASTLNLQPVVAQLAASTIGGEYVDRRGASQFRSQKIVGIELRNGRIQVKSVGCIVPAVSERDVKCPNYSTHLVKSVETIDPAQIVPKTLAVESIDVEGYSRGKGLFFDCKGGTPCSEMRFEDSGTIGTSDTAAYIFCPSDEKCHAAKKAMIALIRSLP